MELPNEYLKEMKDLLKENFNSFFDCYQQESYRGIRINPLKSDIETVQKGIDMKLSPAPFSEYSFFLPKQAQSIGNYPLHHAGAFYIQEPSAASAVTVLSPKPGDKVLDLCAAPGGKSTQIAGCLQGKGLLWSNEVVKNRASVLVCNIERMGIRNAVVSSCHPTVLCNRLEGFFDKILVDAPCSGEGMFRKDSKVSEQWSREHVISCADRQVSILSAASKAVKECGVMVYSTCTFSLEENEGVVSRFLKENDRFILEDSGVSFGRPGYSIIQGDGMEKTRRIFPMDMGEGHFVAKFRCTKGSKGNNVQNYRSKIDPIVKAEAERMFGDLFTIEPYGILSSHKEKILLLPDKLPMIEGIPVLRAGVMLGELKKSRIEPSHALFMASRPEEHKKLLAYRSDSSWIRSFLKGEELEVDDHLSGFIGVAVDSVMIGFGKCSNGRFKNRYPKGLRIL